MNKWILKYFILFFLSWNLWIELEISNCYKNKWKWELSWVGVSELMFDNWIWDNVRGVNVEISFFISFIINFLNFFNVYNFNLKKRKRKKSTN